jgi:hypothetical protein
MKRRKCLKPGVSSALATAFSSAVTIAAADDPRLLADDALALRNGLIHTGRTFAVPPGFQTPS